MKKRRLIVLTLLTVFSVLILAGCQQTTATESTAAASVDTATQSAQMQPESANADASTLTVDDEKIIYGNVTAIDETSITLEVGTLNENAQMDKEMGSGQGGGPPADGEAPADMANGGAEPPSDDALADMPSNGAHAQPPSGEAPVDGGGEGTPSMLTLTGETVILTIPDESIITVTGSASGETGLSAIDVGSTLKITYADDGETVQVVLVMNSEGRFHGGPDNTDTASPES